jgi:Cu2+-exporting ATPase
MNNASDLTRMQGDALLLSENLQLLDLLISQSVKTRRIITENISWALAYNLIGLPLAACGLIPPYLAAIGMSASSLLVILNTLRLSIQPAGVTD